MGRRPRIDLAGFHHIVNRGIERSNVYKSNDDKEKFLEIVCKACEIYKVNIHDYCLTQLHHSFPKNQQNSTISRHQTPILRAKVSRKTNVVPEFT